MKYNKHCNLSQEIWLNILQLYVFGFSIKNFLWNIKPKTYQENWEQLDLEY